MINKENLVLMISIVIVIIVLGNPIPSWNSLKKRIPWVKKKRQERFPAPKELKSVSCSSYQAWETLLEKSDYKLKEEQIKVPAWKLTDLPSNLNQIKNIDKKKKIFLSMVLIGAYHANYRLLYKKERLYRISNTYQQSERLSKEQQTWLKEKFTTYRVDGSDQAEKIEELERKLDIIPLSLVLAQAACESGWGTSRFAQQANNLFGEWTFSSQDKGLIPKERPAGEDYRVEKFSTVQAAIDSYLLNLNSHPAYKKFRNLRWDCRQQEKLITGLELLPGLMKYSEEGQLYINKVKAIIKDNNLVKYDKLLQKTEEE